MRRVRVSNTKYICSLPFRILRDLEFVDYEENTSQENARKLHENEVDVSLLPVSEFALHGGYVGFDFGLAAKEEFGSIFICSDVPIKDIRVIHIDEGFCTTSALLRLLLSEKWGISPKVVYAPIRDPHQFVRNYEAAVILREPNPKYQLRFKYVTDIASQWYEFTQKPFVFSVWSARPGFLTKDECMAFNQMFHLGLKAKASLAQQLAEEKGLCPEAMHRYICQTIRHQIQAEELSGLEEFFRRTSAAGILPPISYSGTTFTLLNNRPVERKKEKSIDEILHGCIQGKRIGIQEAFRLAKDAELADLGLAADQIRTKLFNKRAVRHVLRVEEGSSWEFLEKRLIEASKNGITDINLVPMARTLLSLSACENLIHEISSRFNFEIEAFRIDDLLSVASFENRDVKEVLARLIAVGLTSISSAGCGMLIDGYRKKFGPIRWTSSQILNAFQWFHRLGGRSSCNLSIDAELNWEQTIIHLEKLRHVQDEAPGFRYFHVEDVSPSSPVSLQDRIRVTIVSRLFLDNVPYIQETALSVSPEVGVLNLSFGANEVRINIDKPSGAYGTDTLVDHLRRFGMDFQPVPVYQGGPTGLKQ